MTDLDGRYLTFTRDEWADHFEDSDACVAPVLTLADYREQTLQPLPEGTVFASRLSESVALVQLFTTERVELAKKLAQYRQTLAADAVVWVSWPKKASKRPTDITEDVVREVALPLGFVDVKVCAVDEIWSGLKLVVRKALR